VDVGVVGAREEEAEDIVRVRFDLAVFQQHGPQLVLVLPENQY
jgi:hypothetical protein